jgi:hypothetical protein
MSWMMFLAAVVGSVIVTSFTDWLFFGVLFHDKAKAAPEIWRPLDKASDHNRILISTLFGAVSCAGVAWLCVKTGALDVMPALRLALVVWIASALPLMATQVTWIRLHPLVGASYAAGWLARFAVTGVITALLL